MHISESHADYSEESKEIQMNFQSLTTKKDSSNNSLQRGNILSRNTSNDECDSRSPTGSKYTTFSSDLLHFKSQGGQQDQASP